MTDTLFSTKSKTILDGIIKHNNIANSYIFHGQLGSFVKRASEYFVCQVLGCETVQNNPDIIYVASSDTEKSKESITVEQVRSIQNQVKYGPSKEKHLFVIIEDCDRFTTQSANAFLKTLEEPPEGVHFILLTRNYLDVLPTIRSRSQILPFSKIEDTRVLAFFEKQNPDGVLQSDNIIFIKYFLEKGIWLEFDCISFQDFQKLSLVERLILAESLAKKKEESKLLLLMWIEAAIQLQIDDEKLNKLIEIISQMKYNINLRLQLEALFVNL
jgi:DNA polymerase III delta prime subunit